MSKRHVRVLHDQFRLHLAIDEPKRTLGEVEPVWICRLRKIGHHVQAIQSCEIDIDAPHVMAPEPRAAYRQMSAMCKSLPRDDFEDTHSEWWAAEARNRVLASYDHPSFATLLNLPVEAGGLRSGQDWLSYGRLSTWLSYLAYGYGFALQHLAEALGAEEDVPTRLTSTIMRIAPSPMPTMPAT